MYALSLPPQKFNSCHVYTIEGRKLKGTKIGVASHVTVFILTFMNIHQLVKIFGETDRQTDGIK